MAGNELRGLVAGCPSDPGRWGSRQRVRAMQSTERRVPTKRDAERADSGAGQQAAAAERCEVAVGGLCDAGPRATQGKGMRRLASGVWTVRAIGRRGSAGWVGGGRRVWVVRCSGCRAAWVDWLRGSAGGGSGPCDPPGRTAAGDAGVGGRRRAAGGANRPGRRAARCSGRRSGCSRKPTGRVGGCCGLLCGAVCRLSRSASGASSPAVRRGGRCGLAAEQVGERCGLAGGAARWAVWVGGCGGLAGAEGWLAVG
jgi:hypothetical protein